MSIREFLLILRHRLLKPLELSVLVISFIFTFLLIYALGLIPIIRLLYCKFYQYFPVPNGILRFILWLVIFHSVKILLINIREYTKRRVEYSLNGGNWQKDWVFNGQSYALSNPSRIIVYSSRAGCLLEKYVWKDCEINFEMKFLENALQKHVGIIFRAKDLENYFMLEIFKNNSGNEVYVKPHVRSQGAWEIIQETPVGDFDLMQFQKVMVRVDDIKAYLYISGKKVFEWHLPTHVDINHVEAGVQGTSDEITSRGIIPRIDFRKHYGMIGFRAHPGQGAEIKRLRIKSIDC